MPEEYTTEEKESKSIFTKPLPENFEEILKEYFEKQEECKLNEHQLPCGIEKIVDFGTSYSGIDGHWVKNNYKVTTYKCGYID